VECTLYLDRPLSEDQRRRLQDVLIDWYRAATDISRGQRPVHFMSEVGFLEDEGKPTVEWMVDLANVGFDIFQRLLDEMQRFLDSVGIRTERLVLGRRISG
jgi:hypothetical protein